MAVGTDEDVRSGGFVAGNFRLYQEHRKPGVAEDENFGKLYWVPLHPHEMRGLTVEAVRLTGEPLARTYRLSLVATAIPSGDRFYPSGVVLPEPGTWRLTAASGPDLGCFEVTLRAGPASPAQRRPPRRAPPARSLVGPSALTGWSGAGGAPTLGR